MTVEMLWFRNRDGFWRVRVRGQVITTPHTVFATAVQSTAWQAAIAAGEWSDR